MYPTQGEGAVLTRIVAEPAGPVKLHRVQAARRWLNEAARRQVCDGQVRSRLHADTSPDIPHPPHTHTQRNGLGRLGQHLGQGQKHSTNYKVVVSP